MGSNETRSLWEVYESETEPWKRGRMILVLVGLFYSITQGLIFAATIFSGNIEWALIFAVNVVFFWFLFYLIWIGIHWIRWICGAWNTVLGFCLIIWGWRDSNAFGAGLGTLCFLIGIYLCLSPSVYEFARRQRESVRWKEALLIAVVCLLIVGSLGTALLGLGFVHLQREKEAGLFADEAARRVYLDRDMDWVLAHVTAQSLQHDGKERMTNFFASTRKRLGKIDQISEAHAIVHTGLKLPSTFTSDAEVTAEAETAAGPVELHTVLFDVGHGWEIERMWWTFEAMPENSAPPQ
jgi:hypothetical protein